MALGVAVKHDIAAQIYTRCKAENREGVDVGTLAKECELDSDLLGRTLRHLSVRGIFQEMEPGVFGNTGASSSLISDPDFTAYINIWVQDLVKGAPYFEEYMRRHFKDVDSGMPTPVPFTLFTGGTSWYKWMHLSENKERGKSFDQGMRGMALNEYLSEFISYDYPFKSLPPGTLVVDVGGGVGALAESVLSAAPHLRYIVQDLKTTIDLAHEIATPAMRAWVSEGKLEFHIHDGFLPQPREHDGAVFILKNVLHNWPDAKALEMLRALRQSRPLKVLVLDRMVRPHLRTEAQTEEGEAEIYRPLRDGNKRDSVFAPQSLPTNYDLLMSISHGSKTRLHDEWIRLFSEARFKVSKIYPLRVSTGQSIFEAIPVDDAGD
ncbi:Sterigmatocystin 8-O-methyltransferase [Leucoagaricus sp. SymC.cos]|nr:Sterigmatocystin 8-O-methyltransferase [Leucoagaricus sp. SymC.cos]